MADPKGMAVAAYEPLRYRSFLGLVWMLWRQNSKCRVLDVSANYQLTLPVKWL